MSKSLIINKVPTLVSLSQLEDEGNDSNLPIRNIEGCKLPRFSFSRPNLTKPKKIRSFGNFDDLLCSALENENSSGSPIQVDKMLENSSESSNGQPIPQHSVLDSLILSEWEDRAEEGLFRYDVTACPSHVIDGNFGFIAQLNEGRGSKKRPTEFRVDQVDQEFDNAKFNFGKALQQEVLFSFEESDCEGIDFAPSETVKESPNLVMINVSPIEYGHILLVPKVLDNLRQIVDADSLLLALSFAHSTSNPFLRMGFNSLGAYATINHLHFQAYYLAAAMPLERAKSVEIARRTATFRRFGDVHVHRLIDYPVKGLVFESANSLEDMSYLIASICKELTFRNIPHNLMIADSGARVFLIPNAFSQRKANHELPQDILESQIDPAVFEISGHILTKRKEDYEMVDEEWVKRLLSYASVSEELFQGIISLCKERCA